MLCYNDARDQDWAILKREKSSQVRQLYNESRGTWDEIAATLEIEGINLEGY